MNVYNYWISRRLDVTPYHEVGVAHSDLFFKKRVGKQRKGSLQVVSQSNITLVQASRL